MIALVRPSNAAYGEVVARGATTSLAATVRVLRRGSARRVVMRLGDEVEVTGLVGMGSLGRRSRGLDVERRAGRGEHAVDVEDGDHALLDERDPARHAGAPAVG